MMVGMVGKDEVIVLDVMAETSSISFAFLAMRKVIIFNECHYAEAFL